MTSRISQLGDRLDAASPLPMSHVTSVTSAVAVTVYPSTPTDFVTGPNVEPVGCATHNQTFQPTIPIDCRDFSVVHGNDPISIADNCIRDIAVCASTSGSGGGGAATGTRCKNLEPPNVVHRITIPA